jgi:hypothetical protein
MSAPVSNVLFSCDFSAHPCPIKSGFFVVTFGCLDLLKTHFFRSPSLSIEQSLLQWDSTVCRFDRFKTVCPKPTTIQAKPHPQL